MAEPSAAPTQIGNVSFGDSTRVNTTIRVSVDASSMTRSTLNSTSLCFAEGCDSLIRITSLRIQLPEIFRFQILKPLFELFRVLLSNDCLARKNRRVTAKCESDGVTRTSIHRIF